MIDLHYPANTLLGSNVPKNKFYQKLEVSARLKQRFTDDIASFRWLYKLAPSTLNVADGQRVHEIAIFVATLKQRDCPHDVFLFIDRHLPRHVVFILEHEGQCKWLLNYKEWKNEKAGTFHIVQTFATDWMAPDQLSLPLEGQTMDALYEAMAGRISGFGTTDAADTRRIIDWEDRIRKASRTLEALQRKIKSERQFNRQVELNREARALKQQIADWQQQRNDIKPS